MTEFEFEYKGRLVRCSPVGERGASVSIGSHTDLRRPMWDIEVDDDFIGQVPAKMDETQESVRAAAVKLVEELGGS